MERMLRSGLRDQLDALAIRGQRHLDSEARRAAFAVAADWAARGTVAAALLALAYAAIAGGVAGPLAIFVVVPLLVSCGVFVAARRRRVARSAALALFDRALGLKDRAVIADEFGRSSSWDGFREAALDEARPWIDSALATPVDIGGDDRHAAPRRWLWVAAGCAILALALALAVQHRVTGERTRTGSAGRPAALAPSFPRRIADTIESFVRDDPRAANPAREGVAASGLRAGAATAGEAGATSRPAPGGAGGREASSGERGMGPGQAGAPSGGAAAAASRAGSKASDTKGPHAADDIAAQGDRGGVTPPADASAPNGSDGGRAMHARDAAEPKAQPAGTPSSPRGGTPPSTPPHAASPNDGARPNSRKPQQNAQQSGQGDSRNGSRNGGSGAGRASGMDAIKKPRGVAAILLATPMEDRFIGTPGAGRTSSREQLSPPRAASSDIVRATANGTQTGDAGALLHRPATTHDDRMLATFFRRTNGAGSQ